MAGGGNADGGDGGGPRRPAARDAAAASLERVGDGVLSGKQSALYPVLRNLEGGGLLDSFVEPSVAGPPRRYYRITEAGRQTLQSWAAAWRATRDSVDSVLEGIPA